MFKTQNTQKVKSLVLLIIFLLFNVLMLVPVSNVNAYTDLIRGGSFEEGLGTYWSSWSDASSVRTYTIGRSYYSAFGFGSYSLSIKAESGAPEQRWTSNISGEVKTNTFKVEAGKAYQVSFQSKADTPSNLSFLFQDANTFTAVSGASDVNISSTGFDRQIITIYPTASSLQTILVIQYGDLPTGATVGLDGLQIIEANSSVATTEVKGYAGDNNRFVKINNISFYNISEVEIELPYYDPNTLQITTRRFAPTQMTTTGVYLNMYPGTFAGVGRVYANDQFLGAFTYNMLPKITEFYPSVAQIGQDLTIYGSGFNPGLNTNNTYVVIRSMNEEGKVVSNWIRPHIIDSLMTQLTVTLPEGTIYGSLYVQSSFRNAADVDIVNKSNSVSYSIKPVIDYLNWSKQGFEQVGDKIKIYGNGMTYAPAVRFYNSDNQLIATNKATLVQRGQVEAIEVVTPTNLNDVSVIVYAGGVESDSANALSITGKSVLSSIKSLNKRTNLSSNTSIQAAKVGEEITLSGRALYSPFSSTTVEFQGNGVRLTADITSADTRNGTFVKVIVPEGAQNGYINVNVSGESSNYMPLEIIPTVLNISPVEIIPGQVVTITANGMNNNVNLTRVHFMPMSGETIVLIPDSVTMNGNIATVSVRAPLALSNNSSKVNLQFDKWMDDSSSILNVNPYISSAQIDLDTGVLSIKGYGFSINPREDIITYMYADEAQTVITPKVKMLGVYPSEEGQEIRVKIYDEYYYGFVRVQVGDKVSNDANFGPVVIKKIARRSQFVEHDGQVMGVLYISGYNFGQGEVIVGTNTARTDYRTDFFIIAVVPEANLNDNPVVVTKN